MTNRPSDPSEISAVQEPSPTHAGMYPVLALRDIVFFPGMLVPLFVGREASIKALEYVIQHETPLILVAQRDASQDTPSKDEVHAIGVIANVLQLLKLQDGTIKVLVEATDRVALDTVEDHDACLMARPRLLHIPETESEPLDDATSLQLEALSRLVVEQFEHYAKLHKKMNPESSSLAAQIKDPGKLADSVATHSLLSMETKQELLSTLSVVERLEKLLSLLENEINVLNTEKKIHMNVKRQMEEMHKQHYLNEKLKAIHKELGDEETDEFALLEEQIKKVKLTKEAKERSLTDLKKLRSMNAMSAEASVLRNYLEWLLAIPWNKPKPIKIDLAFAESLLNKDHYGIEKVKERILEHLAVQKRIRKPKGSILCLLGPPGVGKSSLAKSIAQATGRNFVRFSLGGVRDESEIRGHRRTYIGAMPGKLIQSMKKAKYSNPLILLDEIDKMGMDYRGDPASALLEVLDPEQNNAFMDHYLEVEYDLSDVMFVATANTMDMPRPLLDRMEVIRLSGYTEEEKIQIAHHHLVEKQRSLNGLKANEWSLSDEALRDVIRYYTREAGVRNLDRELANLARKAIKEILRTPECKSVHITSSNLADFAGVRRFSFGEAETEAMVGITTGLAYTEVGGDILSIEAVCLPGKGEIHTTGKLGEVMQESAQAAFSYIRSRSLLFGITPLHYQKKNIHIHVPEGATPKDGPSAGVAMCTSIVSALTGIAVRGEVAMTGEITLRGRVLAIGGLKEKLLAALRGGIQTVLIPKENLKDLADVPDNVKQGLQIIGIESVEEAFRHALISPLEPISWSEEDTATPTPVVPLVSSSLNVPPAHRMV